MVPRLEHGLFPHLSFFPPPPPMSSVSVRSSPKPSLLPQTVPAALPLPQPCPGVSQSHSWCPLTPPPGAHGSSSSWRPGAEWGTHATLCKPTLVLIWSHRGSAGAYRVLRPGGSQGSNCTHGALEIQFLQSFTPSHSCYFYGTSWICTRRDGGYW